MAYKIVGRFNKIKLQPSWYKGKPGVQAKKTVYVSREDFDKYSPETIERWGDSMKLIIEIYETDDNGKWVLKYPVWEKLK